jgi:hypothetical protein
MKRDPSAFLRREAPLRIIPVVLDGIIGPVADADAEAVGLVPEHHAVVGLSAQADACLGRGRRVPRLARISHSKGRIGRPGLVKTLLPHTVTTKPDRRSDAHRLYPNAG